MTFEDFWYVVAESRELAAGKVLPRRVLGEWLAVFRGEDGAPAVLRDRCMHRAGRLSDGAADGGRLRCPYHGWTYDEGGLVVAVPSEGARFKSTPSRCARAFAACERDGYVYVRLAGDREGTGDVEPFPMPHWGKRPWRHVRLQNRFANTVTSCAENFIDVPHTAYVHPGIFRTPRGQEIEATVRRRGGSVLVEYRNETDNLGWFSWLLNPSGETIAHEDTFHMPNVTSVTYRFGPRRTFVITSQSVPVDEGETLVYTDLTYDYGVWNPFAGPVVRWQGQKVIDQDIEILGRQGEVIARYGEQFANTAADVIHVLVEAIRQELREGKDPREAPDRTHDITFFV